MLIASEPLLYYVNEWKRCKQMKFKINGPNSNDYYRIRCTCEVCPERNQTFQIVQVKNIREKLVTFCFYVAIKNSPRSTVLCSFLGNPVVSWLFWHHPTVIIRELKVDGKVSDRSAPLRLFMLRVCAYYFFDVTDKNGLQPGPVHVATNYHFNISTPARPITVSD